MTLHWARLWRVLSATAPYVAVFCAGVDAGIYGVHRGWLAW